MTIPNNDAVTQNISDVAYKVKTLTIFAGVNSNNKIVDPSHYDGYVEDDVSFLDLASITWAVFDGDTFLANEEIFIELRWKNFSYALLRLNGNGSYGGPIGLPKIYNDVKPQDRELGEGGGRVRLHAPTNKTDGFIVCVWDKVGDWSGAPYS